MKIRKHKPIKKPKERFIRIGAKIYQVLKEESPTNLKVKLVYIESKFGTKVEDDEPFVMDVSRLTIEEVENYEKNEV